MNHALRKSLVLLEALLRPMRDNELARHILSMDDGDHGPLLDFADGLIGHHTGSLQLRGGRIQVDRNLPMNVAASFNPATQTLGLHYKTHSSLVEWAQKGIPLSSEQVKPRHVEAVHALYGALLKRYYTHEGSDPLHRFLTHISAESATNDLLHTHHAASLPPREELSDDVIHGIRQLSAAMGELYTPPERHQPLRTQMERFLLFNSRMRPSAIRHAIGEASWAWIGRSHTRNPNADHAGEFASHMANALNAGPEVHHTLHEAIGRMMPSIREPWV